LNGRAGRNNDSDESRLLDPEEAGVGEDVADHSTTNRWGPRGISVSADDTLPPEHDSVSDEPVR